MIVRKCDQCGVCFNIEEPHISVSFSSWGTEDEIKPIFPKNQHQNLDYCLKCYKELPFIAKL